MMQQHRLRAGFLSAFLGLSLLAGCGNPPNLDNPNPASLSESPISINNPILPSQPTPTPTTSGTGVSNIEVKRVSQLFLIITITLVIVILILMVVVCLQYYSILRKISKVLPNQIANRVTEFITTEKLDRSGDSSSQFLRTQIEAIYRHVSTPDSPVLNRPVGINHNHDLDHKMTQLSGTAVFTTIRYRGCGGNAPTQGFHPCTPYPDSTKSAVI